MTKQSKNLLANVFSKKMRPLFSIVLDQIGATRVHDCEPPVVLLIACLCAEKRKIAEKPTNHIALAQKNHRLSKRRVSSVNFGQYAVDKQNICSLNHFHLQ